VVSDVPVDDEAPLVTSRISRSAGAQSFRGAHRGRVCVRVFIGVSVRVCCERLRCTVSFSKKDYDNNRKAEMINKTDFQIKTYSDSCKKTEISHCTGNKKPRFFLEI
jgi:hypothetical protein